MRKEYAVISCDQQSGQIFCDKTVANNPMNAFWKVAKERESPFDFDFVAAIPWNAFQILTNRGEIEFPGEGLVSKFTVLSQPEVFNAKKSRKTSL